VIQNFFAARITLGCLSASIQCYQSERFRHLSLQTADCADAKYAEQRVTAMHETTAASLSMTSPQAHLLAGPHLDCAAARQQLCIHSGMGRLAKRKLFT